jgi:hypothetical protein
MKQRPDQKSPIPAAFAAADAPGTRCFVNFIPSRLVVLKILATVVLVFLAFAVATPNCFVPANGAVPEYFKWVGLIPPSVVSVIATYCVWFWK